MATNSAQSRLTLRLNAHPSPSRGRGLFHMRLKELSLQPPTTDEAPTVPIIYHGYGKVLTRYDGTGKQRETERTRCVIVRTYLKLLSAPLRVILKHK